MAFIKLVLELAKSDIRFIITAILLLCFWWKRSDQNFPPGPKGIPTLGVLPWLTNNTSATLQKWSKKYGPVMSVRFGMEDAVILNTFDAVSQAFVKQGKHFSGRRHLPIMTLPNGQKGIVANDGRSFTYLKHFGLKFLKLDMGSTKMESICESEVTAFVKFIRDNNGQPISIANELRKLTGNIITQVLFGKRYRYDDEELIEIVETMGGLLTNATDTPLLVAVRTCFPLTYIPPFSGAVNRLRTRQSYLLDKIGKIVNERKGNYKSDKVETFVDALICEQTMSGDHKTEVTDGVIESYCFDMWLMGLESASSVLNWCLLLLIRHPTLRHSIRKEVVHTFGTNGMPAFSKKQDMPLTSAFILEVMRFKTLVPLGFEHVTTATSTLDGYTIPKGTTVVANLHGVHMDPDVWKNPSKFDPHRHIDANGKLKKTSHKVIPFSLGPRSCIGQSLVRREIFIALVKIVQTFEMTCFNLPPETTSSQTDALICAPPPYSISFRNVAFASPC